MPEIKNTFLKSKMNKDLDARIIPNGEYRDGINISISTSEGSDVGALENIRGNFDLTNFGLTDLNLEVIGSVVDTAKNRIYFFITNFIDGSRTQLENLSATSGSSTSSVGLFTRTGAKNCIAYCEIPYLLDSELSSNSIISKVLVQGAFLNFSKTHPMIGVNILEDFLFFTDNRNQPRKINVETAISNPLTYYTNEDHVSVAKYAPYKAIGFLNTLVTPAVSTLKNETDEWLPASFISPGNAVNNPSGSGFLEFNNSNFGTESKPYGSPINHFGVLANIVGGIRIYRIPVERNSPGNSTWEAEGSNNYAYVRSYSAVSSKDQVFLEDENGIARDPSYFGWGVDLNFYFLGDFGFAIKNPDFKLLFSGDKNFLKDKFIKFSYRFKYNDNEYSLLAPFSQDAFVPKQYGYFIGNDTKETRESSIVKFMENQITTAGLVIDMPYKVNELKDKLKVKELQLIYKSSEENSIKVIADINVDNLSSKISTTTIQNPGTQYALFTFPTSGGSGTGLEVTINTAPGGVVTAFTISNYGEGYLLGDIITVLNGSSNDCNIKITSLESTYIYNYTSQKPIKVLDDQEIIRVNDIIPLRAATQEVVGNRVVYGNFLQNNQTPKSLNYSVLQTKKGDVDASLKKEFLNHTLKQGRSYQVGIVLQDRYGRSSNVIINDSPEGGNLNSTFYSGYTDGGSDTLRWPGNSLAVVFNEEIPRLKNDSYNGVWEENVNPLGWYTYKIVVKQEDQDYYNVYVPGGLSGNIVFSKLNQPLTYSSASTTFHIPLFNDNINKIPRDLKEVGPSDTLYSSTTILYNRVKNSIAYSANIPALNEQNHNSEEVEVVTVKPFRDLGEWTSMKNVNINYIDATTIVDSNDALVVTGPYISPATGVPPGTLVSQFIYPGTAGGVDPFFLDNNKNPLICTLETNSRLGYTAVNQETNSFIFSKELTVFETKPFRSKIDIFYESSSSGLISDFNNSVAYSTGTSGQPTDISSFTPRFIESTSGAQDASNVFYAIDSNGIQVIGNSPRITILNVKKLTQNGNYVNTTSPFVLSTIQNPTLVLPPTYKLITNSSNIYTFNSYIEADYKITFLLTADGKQDVTVEKSIALTNIKPSLYKSMWQDNTTSGFAGTSSPNYGYFIKKYNNITSLDGGSPSSPLLHQLEYIDQSLPTTPYNPYNVQTTALVLKRNSYDNSGNQTTSGDLRIGRVSHSSNGAQDLSVFDGTNDNWTNFNAERNIELLYEVVSAKRFNGYYYDVDQEADPLVARGKYYTNGQDPIDRKQDFLISRQTPSSGILGNQFYLVFNYSGRGSTGTIQNSDLPDNYNSNFKGAWIYYVEFRGYDASNGRGSISSETYNVHFIIYK